MLIVSGLLGFMFILAIMFTLGDLSSILASFTGQPLPQMFLEATGTRGAAFGLFFLSEFDSALSGSSTDPSPCHWSLLRSCMLHRLIKMYLGVSWDTHPLRNANKSFSRDGGLPGARWLGRVSSKLELPLNAFYLMTFIQCALACIYFGSSAAFNAFLGVSVICLGGACFLPILISFLRGRKEVKLGRFYKGKFGYFCNVYVIRSMTSTFTDDSVSIAWFLLAIPLLSFPTGLPVAAATMNCELSLCGHL